mmetsp:Transcript_12396/g.39218  ORF Transcript_12396/g.39218 Transcript_12396/m.39218 type:complete len:224 (-) Transcript_12396:145-816(-)
MFALILFTTLTVTLAAPIFPSYFTASVSINVSSSTTARLFGFLPPSTATHSTTTTTTESHYDGTLYFDSYYAKGFAAHFSAPFSSYPAHVTATLVLDNSTNLVFDPAPGGQCFLVCFDSSDCAKKSCNVIDIFSTALVLFPSATKGGSCSGSVAASSDGTAYTVTSPDKSFTLSYCFARREPYSLIGLAAHSGLGSVNISFAKLDPELPPQSIFGWPGDCGCQ